MSRHWHTGLILALAVGGCGCLVSVRHDVDDPAPQFARALAEAARVQGTGKPGSLNVLVYDPAERELVSVNAPLWLVRQAGSLALRREDDDEGTRFARLCLKPENLEKAGRGVVVEVDEEGGDRVLVWLR
jgi:hypothetical protein